MFTRRLKFQ